MEQIRYPLGPGRRLSRPVKVGSLTIGGNNPIVLQSMITASATDPKRALAQISALDRAGCQLIRLSIPHQKELEATGNLRRLMTEEGIDRPLVADVHFVPQLAIDACEFFEKVRINPGNFSDRPKNSRPSLDNFAVGRERLKEALIPLALAAKKYGRALRVGVNQGSLSERMMAQFGDSPIGMVASALEAVDLLEDLGILDLVVSLKSSNPLTVQKAYRLLDQMREPKEPLALHIGVTEAGEGLMGRAKSLVGIGPLLVDGLGDTIRVSLTEPSEHEIEYGGQLLAALPPQCPPSTSYWTRPLAQNRVGNAVVNLGEVTLGGTSPLAIIAEIGLNKNPQLVPDITVQQGAEGFEIEGHLLKVYPSPIPLPEAWVLDHPSPLFTLRAFYAQLGPSPCPIGLLVSNCALNSLFTQIQIAGVLAEGLVDFLVIQAGLNIKEQTLLAYLLQATRARIFMTDYIACPSCSRTLFDLEETTAKIKAQTRHLKGVKIGIMGCIVNGPGEMADADFGYVGSGLGKIDLYLGQNRVSRGLDEAEAVPALLALIKTEGRWVEP